MGEIKKKLFSQLLRTLYKEEHDLSIKIVPSFFNGLPTTFQEYLRNTGSEMLSQPDSDWSYEAANHMLQTISAACASPEQLRLALGIYTVCAYSQVNALEDALGYAEQLITPPNYAKALSR